MGRIPIPARLMPHRAAIEPYLTWDAFGASNLIRCFVAEALAGAGQTGTERVTQITLITELSTPVPAGSRVTLKDGRKGYAQAVATFDGGGGLPTPDHRMVAVQVATGFGPAYGETVYLLRRTRTRGAGGGSVTTTVQSEIKNAAVRTLSQDETQVGTATQAVDSIEVILPPGTAVTAGDGLVVRGMTFEVDGTPIDVKDSQTTARPGVKVVGVRRH